jgi:hypothetical protein
MIRVVGVFIISAAFSVVTAFLGAWSLHVLWDWFVAAQYGAGPSTAAWFGIGSILRYALAPMFVRLSSKESKAEGFSAIMIERVGNEVAMWFGIMLSLGMCWLFGMLIGWIP